MLVRPTQRFDPSGGRARAWWPASGGGSVRMPHPVAGHARTRIGSRRRSTTAGLDGRIAFVRGHAGRLRAEPVGITVQRRRPRAGQKILPMTDASWINCFSCWARASRRALTIPWTECGSAEAARSACSACICTNCSAYSGFPPARASSCCCASASRTGRPVSESDQLGGVVVRKRRERDRDGVRLSAAPARTALEQLRSGRTHHKQRHPGNPIDQVVDEVQQPLVRPVQIFEERYQRPLLGEPLEQSPPSGEGLAAPVVTHRHDVTAEAEQHTEVPAHPLRLAGFDEDVGHHRRQLRLGRVGVVRLQDAGLRLDHLGQRPEADAFAIRQRAALPPRDQFRLTVDGPGQLVQQPGLAHPGHAQRG